MLYNEVTKKSMDVKGGIVIMNIKRILTGVLAGAFLTTMTAFSAAAASETDDIKLGDPTGDGMINALDASDILNLYANVSVGGSELNDLMFSICDVNKDGAVNSMDASLVLSYYAAVKTSDTEQELEDFISSLVTDVTDYFSIDPDMWQTEPINPFDNPWGKIDPETGKVIGVPEDWNPWGAENPWNSWDPESTDTLWGNITDPETGELISVPSDLDPWNPTNPWNYPADLSEEGINPWEPWGIDWNIYDNVEEQADAIAQDGE